jgi:RTX calcium-binding nonapeptide repeat (4 copies)/WD40-like Beta Propeller Repeat
VKRLLLLAIIGAALAGSGPGHVQALSCNPNSAWQDRFPSWSPNGDAIAFMRQQPGCDPPAESLGFVTPGNREWIYGTDARRTSWAPPSWAPNGLAVAYGRDRESVGVTAPTGPVGDDGPGLFPSWAGDQIAVTVGSSLQVIDLLSGGRRVLVPSYFKPTQSTGVAVWSPDRKWLAFGWKSSTVEGGAIAVVRADGSDFRLLGLGRNQSTNPTWSPDGQTIAFETNRDRDFEIYSVHLDGTGLRNLTSAPQGDDRMPAWHGSTIAFISNRDRSPRELYGFALYTMSSDGRTQLWRAKDLHPYSPLAWSPDGSKIAFASGRECFRWGLYTIEVATDHVEQLTNRCTFYGTGGADVLRGTPFLDYLDGGKGADRIFGLGGPDRLDGGLGNDRLDGGDGRDTIDGGPGDDTVVSRDGFRDLVFCDRGRDTVVADKRDRVSADCERVERR